MCFSWQIYKLYYKHLIRLQRLSLLHEWCNQIACCCLLYVFMNVFLTDVHFVHDVLRHFPPYMTHFAAMALVYFKTSRILHSKNTSLSTCSELLLKSNEVIWCANIIGLGTRMYIDISRSLQLGLYNVIAVCYSIFHAMFSHKYIAYRYNI